MNRARFIIVAIFAAIILAAVLAGCGGETRKSDVLHGAGSSGVTGTVTGRNSTGKASWLRIDGADGVRYKLFVRGSAYRHCHDGEAYPACARKGGAK
jgi:hypothetical protein